MYAEARISNLNSASNSMEGRGRLTFLCFSDSLSGMFFFMLSPDSEQQIARTPGILAICCSGVLAIC